MIGNEVFSLLKPESFSEAETKLQSGDIMLCSGNSAISSLIEKGTDSQFSHVALILQLPITKQWLVLESVETFGVRCVPLEKGYVTNYDDGGQPYDGKILIARHEEMAAKQGELELLYHKAFSLTGDLYDRAALFKIASRIALNEIGINEDGSVKPGQRYICSEYVYACLKAVGINLPYDPLGFIAPSDIANAPGVVPVLQLAL
jgi:hypothetical protein